MTLAKRMLGTNIRLVVGSVTRVEFTGETGPLTSILFKLSLIILDDRLYDLTDVGSRLQVYWSGWDWKAPLVIIVEPFQSLSLCLITVRKSFSPIAFR